MRWLYKVTNTALLNAIREGKADAVRELLKAGAKVDQEDEMVSICLNMCFILPAHCVCHVHVHVGLHATYIYIDMYMMYDL